MRTDKGIPGQVEATLIDCGIFEDSLRQDSGTYMLFHAHETETGPSEKPVYDMMGKESSGEDINEGQTNIDKEEKHSEKISESGCDGRETASQEDIYVDCGRRVIAKEEQTGHYAEILTTKPCSSTISMARRTRESSNPILCLRYGEDEIFEADNESGMDCDIRQTQDDSALYENTPTGTPHVKIQHSRSDSEIFYENMRRNYTRRLDSCHVYENFENGGRHDLSRDESAKNESANTSNENSDSESLYEDINDVYEQMSPQSTSQPIGIVYTSIDFSGKSQSGSPNSLGTVGSCSISSSLGSLERNERARCPSCSSSGFSRSSSKPPELPLRKSNSLSLGARPRSLHLGNSDTLTEFGLYTGTLVGSCGVTKNSPKSVQHIIADFLAREKKERSKPVSLEVNNEFLRLSLNCAPWNLLALNTVDDIGCVTTFSANNKTALGYTVSKPGEDTRCYVIHCSDADAIKNAILSSFRRPDSSLSRWSSMSVLGTTGSNNSRSLPRLRNPPRQNNELATFDDLVYLGSYKVKKSYLVVNDNITSVLDHTDSKHYTYATVELYRDAIHLKDSKKDRILDIHQLEWILSMGLFDEDRRYFAYMSSKAFQGSKTRTFCHVFRCNRVGIASMILETIRQACQATFLAKKHEYPMEFRSRTNSNTSSSSEGSISSSSETMSIGSMSSSPPEIDRKPDYSTPVRRRPRILQKRLSRNRMSTISSYAESTNTDDIPEEKDEPEIVPKVIEDEPKATEQRYNVFYLCSTIVSPPLKAKHVKECLKQYQKSVEKAMKKSTNSGPYYKKAELVITKDGVMIVDDPSKAPQAFFEKTSLATVQAHPDGKCAFAFTTVVSGNTKHKCHLFLQDKEPMEKIIKAIQSHIQ